MQPKTTLNELYKKALAGVRDRKNESEIRKEIGEKGYEQELQCLFNPKAHPVIWKLGACECGDEEQEACAARCDFKAIVPHQEAGIKIDPDKCVACMTCVEACHMGRLEASKDILPVLDMLKTKGDRFVYALVAPAFNGQFPGDVTPGKLRTAFTSIGFDGMIEVALFADILTLKEALEFDQNVRSETDFQLTSCCCPLWIGMIKRVFNQLMPHVPGAVSPMIAAGRAIKQLIPNALTVFIGPCVAKKAEAREKDLAGAIDYVLTFQEVADIFDAMEVDPASLPETERDHSSRAGRIYARAGGVSEAVRETLEKMDPDKPIKIYARHADGVKACKDMLAALQRGETGANFYEGMGCIGGCVGGPKSIIPREIARRFVDEYGDEAQYEIPATNPYVIDLMHRLGFDTIEELLEKSDIFTRTF